MVSTIKVVLSLAVQKVVIKAPSVLYEERELPRRCGDSPIRSL